jgi:hypothetical protein
MLNIEYPELAYTSIDSQSILMQKLNLYGLKWFTSSC